MSRLNRFLIATAVAGLFGLSSTAVAQTGRTQTGGNSLGNQQLGQQADLTQNLSDLNFAGVSNSVVAPSNALGQYYGNPMFLGRIGSSGGNGQLTGGFGQVLYNTTGGTGGGTGRTGATGTGMAGGMTGAAGNFGGTRTGTMGATGSTGFGGTGFGGTGTTGFGNTGTASFGGTGQTGMGLTGGRMGQMGGMNSQLGMGGMNSRMGMGGVGSQFLVQGDRPVASMMAIGAGGRNRNNNNQPTLQNRAQIEIRTVIDQSSRLVSAKTINVDVDPNGIARLTGTVSSPEERKMAANLAQITPGILKVVNELTVSNP